MAQFEQEFSGGESWGHSGSPAASYLNAFQLTKLFQSAL